ncbi:MAG: GNAT family N-acetyltransferase, partial [Brachybacterium tyrofermentans]
MTLALTDLDWPVRTDRLELRPARTEDADAVWPWYRLPDVQEWTTTLSISLEDHQQWWDRSLTSSVVGILDGRI